MCWPQRLLGWPIASYPLFDPAPDWMNNWIEKPRGMAMVMSELLSLFKQNVRTNEQIFWSLFPFDWNFWETAIEEKQIWGFCFKSWAFSSMIIHKNQEPQRICVS